MDTMPNNKCCPKPTAATVGQAAFCPEWTQAAAAWTASPVQNEPDPLPCIVPILSVPISGAQIPVSKATPHPAPELQVATR
eukprot:2107201-Pyramimonas_sp.AAC.1